MFDSTILERSFREIVAEAQSCIEILVPRLFDERAVRAYCRSLARVSLYRSLMGRVARFGPCGLQLELERLRSEPPVRHSADPAYFAECWEREIKALRTQLTRPESAQANS